MLERSEKQGVAWVRMAHGKVSALDLELLEELAKTFEELAAGPARALVLTGSGTVFSAGVDLFRIVDGGAGYVARFLPALEAAFGALFRFPRPVVAAVNGHAIAGGGVMAAAADASLMARGRGTIGVPELRVGVPFPCLALEILRFALPAHEFGPAVTAGALHPPEEALRRGFVHELVDAGALEARAQAIAEDLAAIHPAAFARTKQDARRPALDRVAASAAADDEVRRIWSAPETHAAIREYLERTLRKR